MGIRALCAAAAVAVGVGSAAEAATVSDHDVAITLNDVFYMCNYCNPGERPPTGDTALGLKKGVMEIGHLSIIEDAGRLDYTLTFTGGRVIGTDLQKTNSIWTDYWGFNQFSWDAQTLVGSIRLYNDSIPWESVVNIGIADISTVPLPATAALLPMGIGALAVVRKRRRRAV